MMNMTVSRVALIPCDGYEKDIVFEGIRMGLDLLGGILNYVSTDEKTVLKPNVVTGASPERAVTTHPAIFEAVIRCLKDAGIDNITYGDNSGGSNPDWRKNLEVCGLREVADRYGVRMGDFGSSVTVKFPEGEACRTMHLCKEVTEGALISLCRMKTHSLTRITGAVKNQYGCVFGHYKAAGHALYPTEERFSSMLCDINRRVRPRLFIMDGIVAMEGNGPANGDPKPMGILLISDDPVALDTVFSELVYLDPSLVPTCVAGSRQGLGTMVSGNIRILTPEGEISVSEAVQRYGDPEFNVNRTPGSKAMLLDAIGVKPHYTSRPEVDESVCIGCGVCEQVCPAEGKAVHSGNGKKAAYDYSRCIRCYCCQEMCPKGAITRKETH